MSRISIVIITLVCYKLLLIGIGLWASRRSQTQDDFFLAGRKLGPVVASMSYAASASSAWALLGLSGMAFTAGVSVLWVAGGSILGMLVTWFWIAPRLQRVSHERRQLTFTDFLIDGGSTGTTHGDDAGWRRAIVAVASLVIVFSFTFYVAAQFQGAGNTFASTFGMSMQHSILLGATIIAIYTLLGGFWAVAVTDAMQGILMVLAALLLPLMALAELGGVEGFISGLRQVSTPAQYSLTAANGGWLALGVILGGLGISVGTYGQPHLMVRFMALRDAKALRQARLMTIAWYLVVYLGMVLLGLEGHVLLQSLDNPETVFFAMTERLLPTVLGAVLLAAVLSAIMSTADSQLLVAASVIAHDLGLAGQGQRHQLLVSRLSVVALVVLAVLVALFLPQQIFSRVLFAWMALGSAFGPTVFVRLAGGRPSARAVLASIVTGFTLSVVLSQTPALSGSAIERWVPFVVALLVLLVAGWRRRS